MCRGPLVFRLDAQNSPQTPKFTYEIRKALHMLFIPFTVAMCFHGAALRVTCIILLVWYLVDRLYFTTRM